MTENVPADGTAVSTNKKHTKKTKTEKHSQNM